MANQPFLTTVLPADYLNPYRFQIGLGILGMAVAGVYHPIVGGLLFALYLIIASTSLKGYFRKGSTGVLLLFTAIYILYTSVLLLVLFTFYFQMLYLWSARKPTHLFWITAVGFVHLSIVSTITSSVIFPFIFLAYVVVITQSLLVANFLAGVVREDGALDPKEIRRITPGFLQKIKRTGSWISGLSVAMALLFFPFLPRFQRLSFQPTQFTQASVTGFTDEVALGEIGEIQSDSRVALRIFVPQEIGARIFRWRGAVLEKWNDEKQSWSSQVDRIGRGIDLKDWIPLYDKELPVLEKEIRVNVSSMAAPMIFFPETADGPPKEAAMIGGPFDRVDFDRESWTCTPGGDFTFRSYEYYLRLLAGRSPEEEPHLDQDTRERCLNLSSISNQDFLRQLRARGEEMLSNSGPRPTDIRRMALKLSSGVQMGHSYTLDFTGTEGAKSLSDFIFNLKAGHCEYFATTLTLLLRLYDIPARVVTGFRPGRSNFFDSYQIVRQSDAHSWVEAFIDGEGWTSLDPTPNSTQRINPWAQNLAFVMDIYDFIQLQWNRYILDYSNEDQKDIFTSFSQHLGYLLAPLFFGANALILMRKVLAGLLFLLFVVWLLREVAPELTVLLQSLSLRLPAISWFDSRFRDSHPTTRVFRRIEKDWGRRGLYRAEGETPQAYLERISLKVPEVEDLCRQFLALYYPTRFGSTPSEGSSMRDMKQVAFRLARKSLEVRF